MLKFVYDEKEYVLEENKNVCLLNDEEKPVTGISLDDILNMIGDLDEIDFDTQYYKEACVECLDGVKEKQKFFAFLEYHFYIYTKDQKFVISDIQKEYEGQSFNKLLRANKVDNSYIVSLIICKNCGDTLVQIENCVVWILILNHIKRIIVLMYYSSLYFLYKIKGVLYEKNIVFINKTICRVYIIWSWNCCNA